MWITNCPEAAAKLRKADRDFERENRAIRADITLTLAAKVERIRKNKARREAAYDRLRRELLD